MIVCMGKGFVWGGYYSMAICITHCHHQPPCLSAPSATLRAALQMMYKAAKDAQTYNYYVGGLSHTWMGYYTGMITTDGAILNEW